MKGIRANILAIVAGVVGLASAVIVFLGRPPKGAGRSSRFASKSGGKTSGKNVNSPTDLPAQHWKQALKRTKEALKDKDLGTSAAALSYYATLTFFPALLGLATCYAYFADPHSLLQVLHSIQGLIPPPIYELIYKQLSPLASGSKHGLGVAAIISIGALLWTTSGGMQNLVKATNKAYEADETRKFVKLRLVSVGLSLVMLVIGGLIFAMLLLQKSALTQLGAPAWLAALFPILRWPILIGLISIILSAVYRYAPDRKEPRWQWVSWGATAATVIWLAASALFFIYVQNFGSYTKTYGSFAGLIVLMVWFNITGLIILLGAQVNKKLEEVAPAGTVEEK